MRVYTKLWFLSFIGGVALPWHVTAFSVAPTGPSSGSLPHRTCLTAATDNDNNKISSDSVQDDPSDQRKQEILREESMNAANLQASAAQLQNWSPDDMDRVLASVENMSAAEKEQLQTMGMDPSMMQQAMQQMKDNPAMKEQVVQIMQSMTPEELLQQSAQAQAAMKMQQQQQQSATAKVSSEIAEVEVVQQKKEVDDDKEEEEDDDEPVELNPDVLDAMYKVGELMSDPPEQGGVTLAAFRVLPPITVLMTRTDATGEDDDLLLTDRELRDCWSQGSLGSSRVDRNGFERVWAAIQDNYYNDICEEARERLLLQKKKKKRGAAGSSKTISPPATSALPTMPPNAPMVGATLTPEQLQAQIKNMKDEDMTQMFDQMSNMTPADEARLKAMGVDPAMMKKSADMMKNNPLLRKAATMMMKNTSPDQLMKASQEAQAKMANMSEEEKRRIMDNLK